MAYALTGRSEYLRENSPGLLISVLAHALVLLLVGLNLELMPRRPPQPVRLAIQATVVDASAMREKAAAAERAVRQAEQRRIEQENKRRQEAQEQREEQQRMKQERLAEERQRREQAEAQRREQAQRARAEQVEAQRREQAKRKQEADKAQRARAEEKKAAADAQRKAEAERRKAQTQADLARAMAAEEQLTAAEESGLLDQYAEVIRQKVERNWIRPASAREGISCVVMVKQIPGGEVVDVRIAECNGDAAVVRSIEAAVLRSSPLPPPPDPALFDRSLRFDFRPRD